MDSTSLEAIHEHDEEAEEHSNVSAEDHSVSEAYSSDAFGHEDGWEEPCPPDEGTGGLGREADEAQDAVNEVDEINVSSFGELRLAETTYQSVQESWQVFIAMASSPEAAGEAIYTALFEGAPSLQPLFTTPKAVQAMRFMNGLNQFVTALHDPPALKVFVEASGFGHLALEVTIPRVVIFRDAILDLLQVELGDKLDTNGFDGWKALLNYIGGAIIFVKAHYAERLQVLSESWKEANDKNANTSKFRSLASAEAPGGAKAASTFNRSGDSGSADSTPGRFVQQVPTTYTEMFQFNAAVMGFGRSAWMSEVLAVFDAMVANVANSARLQEECDFLLLRISRCCNAERPNLSEYKSCMLASLRSLLPKSWSTAHETAWSWLWDNVERLLLKNMGNPPRWERSYGKFVDGLDDAAAFAFRAAVYSKFFSLAPSGQDYFKQSNTYLHLIATKVMEMVVDMYREPIRMADEISAVGLRHVGYGIPTELFAPYVSACIDVLGQHCADKDCIEGFRWCLGLIAQSLVRTINEGSTIVMKAINTNTKRSVHRAVACAPRGERSSWCLLVQVGTQAISPLAWALESGSLDAASAIIGDLLKIRADRDRYYFGADELFKRHHDIVKMICDHAPALLPELFDGLIWRSRLTKDGQRRVNYYFKHLLITQEETFAPTLEWIAKFKDPKIVCHPTLVVMSDMLWSRLVSRSFFVRKTWLLLTLAIFIISQSVLEHAAFFDPALEICIVFACRVFIYTLSLGQLVFSHCSQTCRAYRRGSTRTVMNLRVPAYWLAMQEQVSLCLMLLLAVMLVTEPIFYCLGPTARSEVIARASTAGYPYLDTGSAVFTQVCSNADSVRKTPYSTCSMLAMILYYCLLVDIAVFSTRFSAYVLACGRMLSEVALFLFAIFTTIVAFACAFSCLDHEVEDFQGVHTSIKSLWEILLGLFTEARWEELHTEGIILYGCYVFLVVSLVFLTNILIAQLSCSYGTTYANMVGFARLKRTDIVVETMAGVRETRWLAFIKSLHFEKNLEFNEGDVGVAGGVQVFEPSSRNPTTVEAILRYGGTTSSSMPWPETDSAIDDKADRLDNLEKLVHKAMKRFTKSEDRRRGAGGGSSGSLTSSLDDLKSNGSQGSTHSVD